MVMSGDEQVDDDDVMIIDDVKEEKVSLSQQTQKIPSSQAAIRDSRPASPARRSPRTVRMTTPTRRFQTNQSSPSSSVQAAPKAAPPSSHSQPRSSSPLFGSDENHQLHQQHEQQSSSGRLRKVNPNLSVTRLEDEGIEGATESPGLEDVEGYRPADTSSSSPPPYSRQPCSPGRVQKSPNHKTPASNGYNPIITDLDAVEGEEMWPGGSEVVENDGARAMDAVPDEEIVRKLVDQLCIMTVNGQHIFVPPREIDELFRPRKVNEVGLYSARNGGETYGGRDNGGSRGHDDDDDDDLVLVGFSKGTNKDDDSDVQVTGSTQAGLRPPKNTAQLAAIANAFDVGEDDLFQSDEIVPKKRSRHEDKGYVDNGRKLPSSYGGDGGRRQSARIVIKESEREAKREAVGRTLGDKPASWDKFGKPGGRGSGSSKQPATISQSVDLTGSQDEDDVMEIVSDEDRKLQRQVDLDAGSDRAAYDSDDETRANADKIAESGLADLELERSRAQGRSGGKSVGGEEASKTSVSLAQKVGMAVSALPSEYLISRLEGDGKGRNSGGKPGDNRSTSSVIVVDDMDTKEEGGRQELFSKASEIANCSEDELSLPPPKRIAVPMSTIPESMKDDIDDDDDIFQPNRLLVRKSKTPASTYTTRKNSGRSSGQGTGKPEKKQLDMTPNPANWASRHPMEQSIGLVRSAPPAIKSATETISLLDDDDDKSPPKESSGSKRPGSGPANLSTPSVQPQLRDLASKAATERKHQKSIIEGLRSEVDPNRIQPNLPPNPDAIAKRTSYFLTGAGDLVNGGAT
ncbi:hypothetical protein HDU76_007198, partial [Blyttiomyces sp. JEL0837]